MRKVLLPSEPTPGLSSLSTTRYIFCCPWSFPFVACSSLLLLLLLHALPGRLVRRPHVLIAFEVAIYYYSILFAIWQCASPVPTILSTYIHIHKRETRIQWLQAWKILSIRQNYNNHVAPLPYEWLLTPDRRFTNQIWNVTITHALPIEPNH